MSCNRRTFVLGAAAFGLLAACGFTPVYGPGGGADVLLGQIELDAPDTREGYLLTQRLEERLGRGIGGAYALSYEINVDTEGLGTTSEGSTTRYQLLGKVTYTLRDAATGAVLNSRDTSAFSGYSATGSNVATLAAESDATRRLMVILGDQMVDQLILWASAR
ncbi:LPS assembly lipoprotein LptE [Puniceibacterium sediminis]|uniref:LPS-assembly lipoprotein n=1 Tax=Puniceibacterium sediminis TaxID=1608407 RepID=A0A238Y3J8_9RHOB|nr:LPS assembly lipoprotein LptE [Puniceibacterium sediminis]SNR65552.1 LPS-assembly lipoprotein [Puniceibacterium sediminis]